MAKKFFARRTEGGTDADEFESGTRRATDALFDRLPAKTLGPGFEIRRGQSPPEEGVNIVLDRIVIWGTLKIYATIDDERMIERGL
jgi:hypothetical protein